MSTIVMLTQSKFCQCLSSKVYTSKKDKAIRQIIRVLAVVLLTATVAFGNFNLSAYATPCTLTKNQTVKVYSEQLGLRSGIEATNAAYGMADLEGGTPMDAFRWFSNPSGDVARCDRWEDHLYNSIWKIDDLTQGFNLLIVTRAIPTGERYNAPGGRGDKLTFQKVNSLPGDSQIKVSKNFQEGEVENAFNWVLEELNK